MPRVIHITPGEPREFDDGSEAIYRCKHCGGILLTSDLRGRHAGLMDKALAYHLHRNCCSGAALPSVVDGAALWRDFEPPLVALVRAGKTERALELLASGEAERTAPLDTPLRGGATLLHLAAAANSDELMRALFKLFQPQSTCRILRALPKSAATKNWLARLQT